MEKRIGKIERISFGFGGYQDAQIGLSVTLSGDGWGVGDFWGEWAIDRSEHCKWTEHDRITGLGETTMRVRDLLRDAKKKTVDQLRGIPVEVTFDGLALKNWRILKEAIL